MLGRFTYSLLNGLLTATLGGFIMFIICRFSLNSIVIGLFVLLFIFFFLKSYFLGWYDYSHGIQSKPSDIIPDMDNYIALTEMTPKERAMYNAVKKGEKK